MANFSKSKYALDKLAGRKTGYPLATLVFYGPDDTAATKAVVGIKQSEDQTDDDILLRKWFGTEGDLRTDGNVLAEITEHLKEHQVKRLAALDRIFGCPHESGVDYPEQDEWCPHCPFWLKRDRLTGKLIQT